jgi:hypothetical protein
MSNWFITIKKQRDNYPWVNRYQVSAPDLAAATDAGLAIASFEASFHLASVEFRNMKISADPDPGGSTFITVPLTFFGARTEGDNTDSGAGLVLFAQIPPLLAGYPGRKMYRHCLLKSEWRATGDGYDLGAGAAIRSVMEDELPTMQASLTAAGASLTIGRSHRSSSNELLPYDVTTLDTHHGYFDKPDL